ncbi:MAG: hypothetical protein CMG74_04565 [Candidatus Marinimicrobia bacterium]|nr:hypothetical protein [Candidatus Neomarinimicrobiota bacterium]
MIYALLKRRLWLWKNRWMVSLVFLFVGPIILVSMIVFPFKNIFIHSLTGIPFEHWVTPGLIFVISSISLIPFLYREFFSLRIHRKMLVHITMAPHTKQNIVFGYLTVAVFESLFIGLISLSIISILIPLQLSLSQLFMLLIQLILYLYILGNLIVTISLLIDNITPFLLANIYIIILVIFGNGFLIDFGFFPITIESILRLQPLSFPYQSLQIFITGGVIEWTNFAIIFIIFLLWLFTNGLLLQKKLNQ